MPASSSWLAPTLRSLPRPVPRCTTSWHCSLREVSHPEEALETATRNPARFLGCERDLGTVETDKIADLVLLNANPVEVIHNTTEISAVILHGQFFDRKLSDGMMKDATAAGTSKTTAKTQQ